MLNEIVQYLKSCETFYIATMEENQPRVRPFGCATLFEGKLYISTSLQHLKVVSLSLNQHF